MDDEPGHDELAPLEDELRAAVKEALGRGWRLADLRHAVRKVESSLPEVLELLDAGLEAWRRRRRLSVSAAVKQAQLLILLLRTLRPLPPVDDGDVSAHCDPAVLARVRALLAKAESTTFEPEADALTAKAHELMARHAIDRVLLGSTAAEGDVVARRVLIDDPYAKARFHLLGSVARACRCRAVFWPGLGIATVFGVRDDLDACEVLYTSLLLQATSALTRVAPPPWRAAPSQVAAFRRAFLYAFSRRVGERLYAEAERAVDEARAEHGDGLLPVLAAREAAVDAAVDTLTRTKPLRFQASDGHGWAAGAAAADRASLTGQATLPNRPAAIEPGRGSAPQR
jgi:Protein of unknown function (DUF2786)